MKSTLDRPAVPCATELAARQLAVALTWSGRGQPVIPCSRTKKRPLVGGFGRDAKSHELKKFSDRQQIEDWWTNQYVRAHVGILTRRIVVVDLDMPKGTTPGGQETWDRLIAEAGAEPPATYEVRTPSGGAHLYFLQPTGEPIGCATGDGTTPPHLGPGIDVRGVGGLVIAAGSYSYAQGTPYSRVSEPGLIPQPLPGWLLERLRPAETTGRAAIPGPAPYRPTMDASRAERYAYAALDGCVQDILRAAPGDPSRGRTTTLWWSAVRLAELAPSAPHVLTETAVRRALHTAATQAGLTDREATRQIAAGWTRGTRNAGAAV